MAQRCGEHSTASDGHILHISRRDKSGIRHYVAVLCRAYERACALADLGSYCHRPAVHRCGRGGLRRARVAIAFPAQGLDTLLRGYSCPSDSKPCVFRLLCRLYGLLLFTCNAFAENAHTIWLCHSNWRLLRPPALHPRKLRVERNFLSLLASEIWNEYVCLQRRTG